MNFKVLIKKHLLPLSPTYKFAEREMKRLKAKTALLEKEHCYLADYLDAFDYNYLKELDQEHLKHLVKHRLRYEPDLKNPKTFNEKLQWLKINLRKPEMTVMSDKYMVRQYLQEKGFGKYLNKLYGVYSNTEELKADWIRLPSRFVVKTNNDSGGVMLVNDKNSFNQASLNKLEKRLQSNYYYHLVHYHDGQEDIYYRKCEWPYKNIEPCILVEEYLEDQPGSLRDFKVFCFNGKAKFIEVDIDRFTNHQRCFYDSNWIKQSFTIRCPQYQEEVDRPLVLGEMLRQSEKLAGAYPFIRIDWYILGNNKLVLGELTFYPASGAREFDPPEWDRKLGNLIDLSDVCKM